MNWSKCRHPPQTFRPLFFKKIIEVIGMALIELTMRSYVLDLSVQVNIVIPDQRKENEQFKVLYLLHGYMGNHTDWIRYSSLERYLFDHRLMVVMPQVHNSYYTDMKQGMDYFTFVSKELPSYIESIFPVSKHRKDKFVAGLSMGGYGAMKIGLTYPNEFSKIASLSGAVDIESIRRRAKNTSREKLYVGVFGETSNYGTPNDLMYLIHQNINQNVTFPELYIACGTEDFLFEDNETLHKALNTLNIEHTYITAPGDHNWLFWDTFIKEVLSWLSKT